MAKIRNLTNSPYDIRVKGGKTVRLPARGEIANVELDPFYAPLYRALGYFVISEGDDKSKPIEPVKATEQTAQQSEDNTDADKIKQLRETYKLVVGKNPFNGWDAEELQKRIDEASTGE